MSRWYRAYEGTVTDAKLGEVALVAGCSRSVAIAVWHCLLESAASVNDGGRFDATARRVAVILCEPLGVIEAAFSEMASLGMIADGAIAAWSRRQYESDSSTERSRRHRERARDVAAGVAQRCATPPDTETDTELTIPDGMDAVPAPIEPVYSDASHELWGEGPAILEALGVQKSRVRQLIGKWCKDAADDHAGVLGAIRRARDGRVQDPVSWITRAIPTSGGRYGRDDRASGKRRLTGAEQRIAGLAAAAAKFDDQRLSAQAAGQSGSFGGPTLLLLAVPGEPEIPF